MQRTAEHIAHMQTVPARIIVQIFTKQVLDSALYESTREQMARLLAEQGKRLVDLVVDSGPAKRDPAEHPSLVRIARGEADGIALFSSPVRFTPKKSADVLEKHLSGPFVLLTAAELADRGLLPGGTLCPPRPGHARTEAPDEHRPLWQAAQRAAELRAKHFTLNEIGRQLEVEGFRPPRGGQWYASSIANLLRKYAQSNQGSTLYSEQHPQ